MSIQYRVREFCRDARVLNPPPPLVEDLKSGVMFSILAPLLRCCTAVEVEAPPPPASSFVYAQHTTITANGLVHLSVVPPGRLLFSEDSCPKIIWGMSLLDG
jgi:hypothetical protein